VAAWLAGRLSTYVPAYRVRVDGRNEALAGCA
jgi:hypothetical protein